MPEVRFQGQRAEAPMQAAQDQQWLQTFQVQRSVFEAAMHVRDARIAELHEQNVTLRAKIDWLRTELERRISQEKPAPAATPAREVPPLPARALQGGAGIFHG